MKTHNLKSLKRKGRVFKVGYLANGNLACVREGWGYSQYNIYDIYEKKNIIVDNGTRVIRESFDKPFEDVVYNEIAQKDLLAIMEAMAVWNKNDPLKRHLFDETLFPQVYWTVSTKYGCLSVSNGNNDDDNIIKDTNYGFAVINRRSLDYNRGIIYLRNEDKTARILRDFKFEAGVIYNFSPSLTVEERFSFVQNYNLVNHNNVKLYLGKNPLDVAFSNENIALVMAEKGKRSSRIFSILDSETLIEKYKMELPTPFYKLAFSYDGLKLACIGSDIVTEIDIE